MGRPKLTLVRDTSKHAGGPREWVGGRLLPPFFVTGEGEPYRPELILWLELPEGLIVGQSLVEPQKKNGALASALLEAMERPMVGLGRRPAWIRVADATVAEEVRAAIGDVIPIRIEPTPELDEILSLMLESAPPGEETEPSYFEAGRVSAGALAELFAAASVLYGLAPWKVACDSLILRLDIPQLGIDGACLSIIGAAGIRRGLLIFPSLEAYEDFERAADTPRALDGWIETTAPILALCFERAADLPPSMLREAHEHGWPLADASAYPVVQHREPDGIGRPLTERDVCVASACASGLAAFFAKHRELFEADDIEPVCESYTDDRDLTVRFTLPYEAFELFDVGDSVPRAKVDYHPATALEAVGKVGRNEPCPCGSGKKYKKCHLVSDQAERKADSDSAALHALDRRLVHEMWMFAKMRFEEEWLRVRRQLAEEDEHTVLALMVPWSVYHLAVCGRQLLEWFLEHRGQRLSALERAWLDAQARAWLSVWEVTDVSPGEWITLEDPLSGEVRRVIERSASEILVKRDAVLARVVEHAGVALLCGMHPRPLPPADAAEVVRRARSRLRRQRAVPVERLQKESIGRYLIRRWEEAVEEHDRRRATPPRLRNTDGDPLLLTTDHFEIEPCARAEVESRLGTIEGVQPPDPDDESPSYFFERPGNAMHRFLESTMIGRAWVTDDGLRIETNSRERTEALRSLVEHTCGGLIRHREREHVDPIERLRDPDAQPPGKDPLPPEAQQLLLDFKERHYADWADHPLPVLGGRTPRQAVRTKRGRAEVDMLLKQIENDEARLSELERFDVSNLRHQLELDTSPHGARGSV